jgi:PPK2 family polyphosphate:nucleotide phosphotransferase
MSPSMRERLAFANGSGSLAGIDPGSRPGAPKKSALKTKLADGAGTIADLQEKLWAEATAGGSRRVLLLLQGIDTAGKGGTTEHVIGECGPIGVQYTAFGKPTKEELRHDFLWRIKKHVPPPGVIGIFDRSHYEDVLIVRVHDLVPPEEWEQRYDKINAFERDLVAHGTTVLKVFLHISNERQRKRLLRRLRRPDKHWKFNVADLDERALWPKYQEAFQAMLERCDTPDAPWYVVPSDSKKYRNWAVAQLLLETLESLDPQYPQIDLDVPALKARLAPPN